MRALGYAEGNNLVIEQRYAIGAEQLAGLAAELVAARVDVFVTSANDPLQAAKNTNGARVGVLTPVVRPQGSMPAVEATARALGLAITRLEVQVADDIEPAFATAAKVRVAALLILSLPLFNAQKQRIIELAAKHRLPAMYEDREFAEAGGRYHQSEDRPGAGHHNRAGAVVAGGRDPWCLRAYQSNWRRCVPPHPRRSQAHAP